MPKSTVHSAVDTAALYFTPRLREAFSELHAQPLTVVEAPMGYGKTVAAREVLHTSRLRVVWTAILGPSAESCWKSFCFEMMRVAPELTDATEALLRLGFPFDAVKAEAARLILFTTHFAQPTIFVFDDVHLLSAQEGRGFVRFCELLAQSGIPDLRLMCITRSAWTGEKREMLRLKGILSVVGRDVLALSPAEIREYYALCGFSPSLDEVRKLHTATSGWFSALYLYLLYYAKGGVFSGQVTEPLIRSLIEKEAYAPLSPALKEVLFALAPLEQVTAEQADFLYGNDTRPLLNELTCKNAFVFFDPERGVYTLHSIFRQYLLELFNRLTEKRQKAIRRRCGDWFMGAGEIAAAMEAYCTAGEYEQALTALESDMGRHFVTENAGLFNELFKSCPEAVLERHLGAAFKFAIAAFSAADFASFGRQLAWLAKQCAALPPGQEADAWRGELEFLHSLAAFNDIEAMSVHHRRANYLLAKPTGLFGQNAPWTLGNPSVLFMFYRTSGKLHEELRHMHDCLPHYYQLASYHGAGGEFLMEAEALYNAGRFAEAAILCHRAEAMADHHGQLGNVICALFLRMRLALMDGNLERAQGLIMAMRSLLVTNRDYFLLHTVDMCEGWLYAHLRRPEKIPAWLRSELAEGSRLYAFARGWYYIVHGRALLLGKEYARVLGLFGYLLEKGLFAKHLLFSIHAHIYLAAAYQGQGKAAPAATALQSALDAALPDEVTMPFAENYDLLAPLFKTRMRGRPDKQFKALLVLAEHVEVLRRAMIGKSSDHRRFDLTRREYETARFMAEGLSSDEIALRLRVSLNTVKFHLKNAYRKTGTSSRLALKIMLES